MFDAVVGARVVHLVSGVLLAGSLLFEACIGSPVLARRQPRLDWRARRQHQLQILHWSSLGAVIVSGVMWLLLVAGQISDGSWQSRLSDGTLLVVLKETQFGQVFVVRAVLAAALVVMLLIQNSPWNSTIAASSALAMLAALAWTGHAGAAVGRSGTLHLVADIVHLAAAGAWIGGLLPLWLMVGHYRREGTSEAVASASAILLRFSSLGLASVSALFASGTVNSWFLTGGPNGLTGTVYGQWLMVKLGLFCCMLVFAATNRFRLVTQLGSSNTGTTNTEALLRLRSNTLAELCLGIAILLIVALLGTLEPAAHHHG